MEQAFNPTILRERALQYLTEGDESRAAEWLGECPLVDASIRREFSNDLAVDLVFGCSRRNIEAFQDEQGVVADQIYSAIVAVTRPIEVRYTIKLQWLTPDELAEVNKVLE